MMVLQRPFPARAPGATVAAFALPLVAALCFAVLTGHVWEDWYITYRSSRNLALGYGLVYDLGERVHSFTSPLGTLVPAAIRALLPAVSDDAVLWIFRIVQSVMLGLGGLMLLSIARACRLSLWPCIFLIGMLSLDAKTLDFATNGMETGFLVFFILLAVRAGLTFTPRTALITGAAWAGLMWTRPDGFIYVAGLAAGVFLFAPSLLELRRAQLLRPWIKAGIVASVLYLPWIVWTQLYYGSFVPHSLTAKSLNGQPHAILEALLFPVTGLRFITALDFTFSPAYITFGGWPTVIRLASRMIAWACCFVWVVPVFKPATRALSVATLVVQLYLSFAAPFAYPWYMPGATILSLVVLGLALQDVIDCAPPVARHGRARRVRRWLVPAATLCALAASVTVTSLYAYEAKVQQSVIEDHGRRQIGLWLHQHAASPQDRVFLEPLGYIGYFSNLRMYGFPGQSSPELVAARRTLKCFDGSPCFATLIAYLKPEWVVLRPAEVAAVTASDATLLSETYQLQQTFDVSQQISAYSFLPGRPWLQFDQTFRVYHRNPDRTT